MLPHALQFGKDSSLLESRGDVLRLAGLSVVNTQSASQCVCEFASGRFSFVFLCHSLSRNERLYMAKFVHDHCLCTPVILVANSLELDRNMDMVLDNGPEGLVKEVRRMIGNSQQYERTEHPLPARQAFLQ